MAVISLPTGFSPMDNLLKTDLKDKWKRVGTFKRAGVLVPLFSVYSKKSIGIGDFADLQLLIDWAKRSGNSIIQLLPLNEVGALFCPYDAISSFALEPAYISFEGLVPISNKGIQNKIKKTKQLFSVRRDYLDYAIKKEKLSLLREIYLEGSLSESLELKKFREENGYWLLDFALYKVIKDCYEGSPWYEWETKFKDRDKLAVESFRIAYTKEINFQVWMQWLAFRQLKIAKEYARTKKVLLEGDLPLLVSRDSADVWAHPEFFKLDYASGAPPDMYCAEGQRWGMPTYNWQGIEADGFRYLKEKLKIAQEFYDILRIDHVVGLFRIWSIPYNEPLENKGLNGFFVPEDENKRAEQGRKLLKTLLGNTNMLLCAEDLGVVPKVCTDTLRELGILGNEVQRWAKDWKIKHDFLKSQDYREFSVSMLSTHDTTNWASWWENEAGTVDEELFIRKCSDHRQINFSVIKEKLFDLPNSAYGRLRWLKEIDSANKLEAILGRKKEELADFIELYENSYQEKEKLWRHLKLTGPMREKCDREIVGAALNITLESSAVFCINTLIDYLYLNDIFKGNPYQYRINTPGTISHKNWSLRLPISLEELLEHKVNKEISNMIASSGRR